MTRDEGGFITLAALMFSVAFMSIAAVLLDGGSRLVAKQRALDEAAATAEHALRSIDVSHSSRGGLRLDEEVAERDALHFLARLGRDGDVAVEGLAVTVTVRIRYEGRLFGIFDGTVSGTATARPLTGIREADR